MPGQETTVKQNQLDRNLFSKEAKNENNERRILGQGDQNIIPESMEIETVQEQLQRVEEYQIDQNVKRRIVPPTNTPIETIQGKSELEPSNFLFQKFQLFGSQSQKDESVHKFNIFDAQVKLENIKNDADLNQPDQKSLWESSKDMIQGFKDKLLGSPQEIQNKYELEGGNISTTTQHQIINQERSHQFEAEPYFDQKILQKLTQDNHQSDDEVIETFDSKYQEQINDQQIDENKKQNLNEKMML